ncbi:RICIN domain-containing protein [Streptomyces montanisoli]|uniref:RICIN domain-containing protein n=1 Tax=Streptomyces montanisoli TaxID=2798581 RepID=A0A940M9J0_9ACTN|nr:RICIN domain-containing protein [Streptomyces montanisoli]MBP0456005.1 RICIN domain-containing protein [Streptomyces montanisoli]
MPSVRSAVASALAAPALLLCLTTPAAAAQAGTVQDGTYYVKDVASGRCLAGTRLETCGVDGTEWVLRNHADGTVQFVRPGPDSRCLSMPRTLGYPAPVRVDACGSAPSQSASGEAGTDAAGDDAADDAAVDDNAADASGAVPTGRAERADRWRIEGWPDGPVTIAHAYPPAGRLVVQGSSVRVSNNSSAMWVFLPVDA